MPVVRSFLTVPHLHPDIEFGVQDAVATLAGAIDDRLVPLAAPRAGDAFVVQGGGDLPGGVAGSVVAADPADDFRLRLNDPHFAAFLALAEEVRAGGRAA